MSRPNKVRGRGIPLPLCASGEFDPRAVGAPIREGQREFDFTSEIDAAFRSHNDRVPPTSYCGD